MMPTLPPPPICQVCGERSPTVADRHGLAACQSCARTLPPWEERDIRPRSTRGRQAELWPAEPELPMRTAAEPPLGGRRGDTGTLGVPMGASMPCARCGAQIAAGRPAWLRSGRPYHGACAEEVDHGR